MLSNRTRGLSSTAYTPYAAADTVDTNYWQMGSAVALGVAMIAMTCTSFAAVYYMEDTIENKRKECEAFPVDEVGERGRGGVRGG